MSLSIRRARPDEAGLVLSLVRELAEYEKLSHEVEATEADIDAALFGSHPRLFCEIAECEGKPVGFAVWFINFSTFSGRSGIYLEDLFVRPAQRGKGIGKALLTAAIDTARKAGADHFELTTGETDTEARGLYESFNLTNREGSPDGPRMLYYEIDL